MKKALILALFMLCGAPRASAQPSGVSGLVTDEGGRPVTGVVVVTPSGSRTASDKDGLFFLAGEGGPVRFRHLAFLTLDTLLATGRHTIVLRPATLESDDVVVTATRTDRDAEQVPVPVSVVTKQDIAALGQVRLANVLAEQTGLQLVASFGTGLQLQGFDPDYTLIMIDGEPVIGRAAGTLDLRRLPAGNIKRIETVKGPSSALWGSDALAGVVNIITESPSTAFSGSAQVRAASFASYDASVNLQQKTARQGTSLFLNANGTDGYDLQPDVAGQTGPSYRNVSLQVKETVEIGDETSFSVQARGFSEELDDSGALGLSGSEESAAVNTQRTKEFSLNPVLKSTIRPGVHLTVRQYSTRYENIFTNLEADAGVDAESAFRQSFDKAEFQLDRARSGNSWVTMGGGYWRESVEADRYINTPAFTLRFFYAQHEWHVKPGFDVVYGFRVDRHSEYAPQFSPKFSTRFQVSQALTLRASAGRGFKAPDFRQLLLGFTNAVAGYSIYGSQAISGALADLEARGDLRQVTINPDELGEIRAEQSWAFNAGGDWQLTQNLQFRANFFYNLVDDMIDVRPVAFRNNGATVYTYINLNSVFTRGAELEARWTPSRSITVQAGYQLLDARDRDVLERIDAGRVYRTVGTSGRVVRVSRAEYGGLMNRSRHMANVNIQFRPEHSAWSGSFRIQARSRYGMGDFNGNGILDVEREYAPGYALMNVNLQRRFGRLSLTAGVDNLANRTNPQYQPFLPGRIFYTTLQASF